MPLLQQLPALRPAAVFFDVDDTVAPSTRCINAGMAAALQALCDAGMHLGFVSGGSVEQMHKQVSLGLARPHILLGTSGSHAVQVGADGGRRELFKRGFSEAERAEILAALDALRTEYGIHSETTAEDQLQDRGCQFTLSALGRGADDAHKRAFDPDGGKRRAWVAFLTRRLGEGRFEIKVGGTTSVDLTSRGVDKASGLLELLKRLDWDPQHALYFGDRFEETGNDHPVMAIMDCLAVEGPEQTLAYVQGLLRK
jgi:HAD superfamily hydrolase (TIGR01484 family)